MSSRVPIGGVVLIVILRIKICPPNSVNFWSLCSFWCEYSFERVSYVVKIYVYVSHIAAHLAIFDTTLFFPVLGLQRSGVFSEFGGNPEKKKLKNSSKSLRKKK